MFFINILFRLKFRY